MFTGYFIASLHKSAQTGRSWPIGGNWYPDESYKTDGTWFLSIEENFVIKELTLYTKQKKYFNRPSAAVFIGAVIKG